MRSPSDADLCGRIATLLEVAPGRCTPATPLHALSTDSFCMVEVAIEIEDCYHVILEQADLQRLTTVGDLAALVRERSA